jgi:predicted AAA+ superfamily ATPase
MLTMYIDRLLLSKIEESKKSILLLGPRQTGKSTLIRQLQPQLVIDLSDQQLFLDFSSNPSELKERLQSPSPKTVFIDEVQRLPSLLDTIQSIIDQKSGVRFYLTGSSARKLKRGGANLLPGRIHTYPLGPLSSQELNYEMNTGEALSTGLLPGIYIEPSTAEKIKTLRSYAATYLKEEIQAEALSKNLEGFSRFLFVAASVSGQFLDISKLASQAQISRQSATRYFEILEDTLIVNRCSSFAKSLRKRLIQHPKFFFFDTGVLNALLGNFVASNDRKGLLFEHLFFNQILSSCAHSDQDARISTYRTEHGSEVDFIVELSGQVWAIELKASRVVSRGDLIGLKNFSKFYQKPHQAMVAYLGAVEKKIEGITICSWQIALKKMGL